MEPLSPSSAVHGSTGGPVESPGGGRTHGPEESLASPIKVKPHVSADVLLETVGFGLSKSIEEAQERAARAAQEAERLQAMATKAKTRSETLHQEAAALEHGQEAFATRIQTSWRRWRAQSAFAVVRQASVTLAAVLMLARRRALWRRCRTRLEAKWTARRKAARTIQQAARRRALLLRGRAQRAALRRAACSIILSTLHRSVWRRVANHLDKRERERRAREKRLARRIEVWRRHGSSAPQPKQPRWVHVHPRPRPSPSEAVRTTAVSRGVLPSGDRPIDAGYLGLATRSPCQENSRDGTTSVHALPLEHYGAGGSLHGDRVGRAHRIPDDGEPRLHLFVAPPASPHREQQACPRGLPARPTCVCMGDTASSPAGHTHWNSRRPATAHSPGPLPGSDGKLARMAQIATKGRRPYEYSSLTGVETKPCEVAAFGPDSIGLEAGRFG